ncbi:hypothetical protein, partial [Pandoraea sputorum]
MPVYASEYTLNTRLRLLDVRSRPLLISALFALSPLNQALADASTAGASLVTLGAVTVTGDQAGPLASRSILSSVDVVGADLL